MDRGGGWEGKIALISPVSDSFAPSKGKTYRILNEIRLLPYRRLGNGLIASMPIRLLTETAKPAMNVPVTTDSEVESDIDIYIQIMPFRDSSLHFSIALCLLGNESEFPHFLRPLVYSTDDDFVISSGFGRGCGTGDYG